MFKSKPWKHQNQNTPYQDQLGLLLDKLKSELEMKNMFMVSTPQAQKSKKQQRKPQKRFRPETYHYKEPQKLICLPDIKVNLSGNPITIDSYKFQLKPLNIKTPRYQTPIKSSRQQQHSIQSKSVMPQQHYSDYEILRKWSVIDSEMTIPGN